jgi:hypothetical protein
MASVLLSLGTGLEAKELVGMVVEDERMPAFHVRMEQVVARTNSSLYLSVVY